jgi:ATP-dependent Clp protease ATP-binding subunit ClpX
MVTLERLPSAAEMVRLLDRTVTGQSRAKRDLSAAVYRHYLGLAWRDSENSEGRDFGRQHVLLLGPTGCGKTLMASTLARLLGVPFAFAATTAMTESGYVGDEVEAPFETLLRAAGGDPRRAERGIVLLDEFDKVRRQRTGGVRDVSGEGVQNGLLTLFDGRMVRGGPKDKPVEMDSSRTLFVCTGAFGGLADIVRARLRRTTRERGGRFGFAATPAGERLTDDDALTCVTSGDLVEYGLLPEMLGRFAVVTAVHGLDERALADILAHAEGSALARYSTQFELHGITLDVPEESRLALARRALALGTGARALARVVGDTLASVSWRLPELADDRVIGVRLGVAAAEGDAEPELVRRPAGTPAAPNMAETLRAFALGGSHGPRPAETARARSAPRPPRRGEHHGPDLFGGMPGGPSPPSGERAGGVTGLLGLDARQLRARLACAKMTADPGDPSAERRSAWLELEQRLDARPAEFLHLLESIRRRGSTLSRVVEAWRAADSDSAAAILHYHDFLGAKRAWEKCRREDPPGG